MQTGLCNHCTSIYSYHACLIITYLYSKARCVAKGKKRYARSESTTLYKINLAGHENEHNICSSEIWRAHEGAERATPDLRSIVPDLSRLLEGLRRPISS